MNEEKKDIIKNTFESAYKCTIGNLPIIGNALNELAFDFSSRLKQDRLNRFSEKLREYMERADDNIINIDNIQTEDFHDIFESILQYVSRTSSEGKLERFKNILLKQLMVSNDYDIIQAYIDITVKLSDKHVEILHFYEKISDKQSEKKGLIRLREKRIQDLKRDLREADILKIDENTLKDNKEVILSKIESCEKELEEIRAEYLSEQYSGNGLNESNDMDWLNVHFVRDMENMSLLKKDDINSGGIVGENYYSLTSFGKRYLNFVREL